jgi:GNAT superfamily N-acetyltransferase
LLRVTGLSPQSVVAVEHGDRQSRRSRWSSVCASGLHVLVDDSFRLRIGTDSDGASLDSLLAQLHGGYEAGSFRPSRFRSGTRTFVAEADGSVIGLLLGAFVDLGIANETCGYLEELVVDTGHRGARIGDALVEAWKSWLRSEGVQLGFVSTTPDGPQSFYERCGFRRCVGPWLVWSEPSEPS